MNIKTFIAAAVVALTAACTQAEQTEVLVDETAETAEAAAAETTVEAAK